MSYGLQELVAYDFANDESEMFAEAANNLLVSNHSYGFDAGWNFNAIQNRWNFLEVLVQLKTINLGIIHRRRRNGILSLTTPPYQPDRKSGRQ
ncbi:MAG: hypothetical protein WDO71_29350 [Bacteroidota bacterium]